MIVNNGFSKLTPAPAAPRPASESAAPPSDGFTRQVTPFGGAYYRKILSPASPDWKGIELEGRLPEISFDPSRAYLGDKKGDRVGDYTAGPLDRPSVYTGGTGEGGKEVDCGLSLDRVWSAPNSGSFTGNPGGSDDRDAANRFTEQDRDGTTVVLDGNGKVCATGATASQEFLADKQLNFAFRPYIRDSAGHWITPQPPGSSNDHYFYPGEEIKMSLQEVDPTHLQLEIDGQGESYRQTFEQAGFAPGEPHSFKRVNSIDQFRIVDGHRKGNEGQPVIPTASTATDAVWNKAVLLKNNGQQVPMVGKGFTEVVGSDLASRYDRVFEVSPTTAMGGESISINPEA